MPPLELKRGEGVRTLFGPGPAEAYRPTVPDRRDKRDPVQLGKAVLGGTAQGRRWLI